MADRGKAGRKIDSWKDEMIEGCQDRCLTGYRPFGPLPKNRKKMREAKFGMKQKELVVVRRNCKDEGARGEKDTDREIDGDRQRQVQRVKNGKNNGIPEWFRLERTAEQTHLFMERQIEDHRDKRKPPRWIPLSKGAHAEVAQAL